MHSHAAFVEDSHNRLGVTKCAGHRLAKLHFLQRQFEPFQIPDMTLIVGHFAITKPLPQAVSKISIGKFLTPKGTVFDAHFRKRPV